MNHKYRHILEECGFTEKSREEAKERKVEKLETFLYGGKGSQFLWNVWEEFMKGRGHEGIREKGEEECGQGDIGRGRSDRGAFVFTVCLSLILFLPLF